jgi:hypothetical protein
MVVKDYIGYEELYHEESSRMKINFLGDFTLLKVNEEFRNF